MRGRTKIAIVLALAGLIAAVTPVLASSTNDGLKPITGYTGKVENRVLSDTANGREASVMIQLTQQADVSAAYGMKDQDARGWYVYRTLKRQADRTQGPLRRLLEAQGVSYKAFWVANAIAANGVDRSLVNTLAARSDVNVIESNDRSNWLTGDMADLAASSFDSLSRIEALGPSEPNVIEPGVNQVKAPNVWSLGFNGTVVTDGGSRHVCAVEEVVAGLLVVGRADSAAGVDGVPPVVVVIRGASVPAPVVRLERVVRPPHAGVLVCDDDAGPVEAERPDVRRLHLGDAGLDGPRARWRRRLEHRNRVEGVVGRVCRQPVRGVVRLDEIDVGACRERVHQAAVDTLRSDDVRYPERLVRDTMGLKEPTERSLGPVGLALESAIDVPPSSVLILHPVGGTDVRLLREMDHDRAFATIRRVAQHSVLDLARVAGDRLHTLALAARQDWCYDCDQPCEREHDRDLHSSTHNRSPPWVRWAGD